MKEYISTGKNVDIAIDEGLRFLGLNREDVDIKILETGGLFKKAKVCLIYNDIQEDIDQINNEKENSKEKIKEELIQTATEEKEDKIENVVEDNSQLQQENQSVENIDELKNRISIFLKNLASKFNLEVNVDCVIEDNNINFVVNGSNLGKLIGYHGETLNAIQNFLSCLKYSGEGKYRIHLDIGNYKKEREQDLIALANKMADKAEQIERNVHLDPMNAYERRIIHSTLQSRELVETESMGEGDKRHVVIKFKR